jgi:signal peptidase I
LRAEPQRSSRWKRAALAGALSLFFSGMGQLYNRQPRKALLLGVLGHFAGVLLEHTRILLSFTTLVAFLLVGAAWKLLVVTDAVYVAAKGKKPEAPVPLPKLVYPVLVVLLICAALFPSYETVKRRTGFSAFRIPSVSMCPTICIGDRIDADMNAYRSQPVQRGDLILLKHASSEALFVKRVIGLPGDVVSPGPDGSILVNGQPFRPPQSCPRPVWPNGEPADYTGFQEIRVAEGNYFVVGDNLQSSFDSRVPDFGPVTASMIRGKPLFLYWSPTHSRIGCALH